MIRDFDGKTPRIADTAFVSEAAYIVGDVEVGENSNIWPGAVIRGDFGSIKIGRQVSVEDNCVIHSGSPYTFAGNVSIGDRVVIGHGAVVNCRKISNSVLVGMNATLLHDAEIGDFCIIGAGCLIGEGVEIPRRSVVYGVPGRIVGSPTEKQLWWIEEAYKGYEVLTRKYKAQGL
jgi:carbonic anhydrase/acetyltransferase-like protein (isoleucine patch superfamily)